MTLDTCSTKSRLPATVLLKPCPECGREMALKETGATGYVTGCIAELTCGYEEPAPPDALNRRTGAPRLFD